MLLEATTNFNHSINPHSIQKLTIYNRDAMQQCHSRFPFVNELTLTESFEILYTCITDNLDRIIPLERLTQLTVECERFPFERFVKLLHFTPNLHNLKLQSVLFIPFDFISINEDDKSQSISYMNTVTTLTVSRKIALQEVQLLIMHFSRLKSLTINLHQDDVESTVEFLSSKLNAINGDLSSLCILQLERFPHVSERLQNYSLKRIASKLYFWR